MAFIPINLDGQLGLVRDVPGHLLKPNAWTDAQNARMDNRIAGSVSGHEERYATPPFAPHAVFYVPGESDLFWVIAGLTDVSAHNGSSYTEITRSAGDYTGDADDRWNGGVLSGILVLNNGVDDPQHWATASTGTLLADLPNWPANTKAKVVRPFGNFLVALYITESGTQYPYLVKWSHPADPGSVPATWDETDATKDAGEYDLGQTKDALVDCLPLGRNMNVIYKEHSTWSMQFIGHPYIFKFSDSPLFGNQGMFTQQCAVEFESGHHAVLTRGDFIIHNGQGFESKIDARNRNWLFSAIDPDTWNRTFVAHHPQFNEVWICFPSVGASYPDQALIWNYREDTWYPRDLPEIADMKLGVVNPATDDSWDTGPNTTWDEGAVIPWDTTTAEPTRYKPLMASPANTKLYEVDKTEQFDGTEFLTVLERDGLAVEHIKPDDSLTINTESWKFLRGIRPRFQAPPASVVYVWVGTRDHINAKTVWHGPYAVDADSDYKVDVTWAGRLFGIRFQSTDPFKIDGYDLDITRMSLY